MFCNLMVRVYYTYQPVYSFLTANFKSLNTVIAEKYCPCQSFTDRIQFFLTTVKVFGLNYFMGRCVTFCDVLTGKKLFLRATVE